MLTIVTAFLWGLIQPIIVGFWPWLLGGAGAILAFLFSPTIRKYTLAILAVLAILIVTFIGGYNANHTVKTVTHECSEFRKVLVSGPATDKAMKIFQRHGLCQ